jgi:hypothetical protein
MDKFASFGTGRTSPAIGAVAVTPSDTTDLDFSIRAVTINGAGTISYILDTVTYTTGTLPVGTYAMQADRIRATGTTATGITGWI